MDSFEARLQFIQILKNLQKSLTILRTGTEDDGRSDSPSLNRSQGTDPIQFYLKNYTQHYEDFHQCLFDTMSKMDPLDRLNILLYYTRIMFILKNRPTDFNAQVLNQHLLPSIDRLFLLALPANDWTSLTNLKACIETFEWLNQECGNVVEFTDKYVQPDNSTPISELKWFEPSTESTNMTHSFQTVTQLLHDRLTKQHYLIEYYRNNGVCNMPTTTASSTILHRMENDREKHKRLKENNWVLERPTNKIVDPKEFQSLWENKPNNTMTKQDYMNVKELNRIARQSYSIGYGH
ncbi:hypothetical protein HG537_0G00610 [Torulaspora globosa]|uniref:CTD kinase subunit gamma Ctk3 C-terminal domain-containing protein n=1 Tax=Torulaspora globosa TaxID=48254 RepID=A0A7H9HY86_9SACH|nr:hypothetical protein HG537_0G00610 [Torulaspora sp. CBS 2947]